MIKIILFLSIIFSFSSCGYPDIDNVPDFSKVDLNSDEIIDYCNNVHLEQKNIDKCINDHKNKK